MATGTVKWFNDTKGYGFIKPDTEGEDLFVHHRQIAGEGHRTLVEGSAWSSRRAEARREWKQPRSVRRRRERRRGIGLRVRVRQPRLRRTALPRQRSVRLVHARLPPLVPNGRLSWAHARPHRDTA